MTGEEIRPSRLQWWWLVGAFAALAGAGLLAILMGAVDLDARSVLLSVADRVPFADVDSGLNDRQEAILWELRKPRDPHGANVGGMLSVACGTYQ